MDPTASHIDEIIGETDISLRSSRSNLQSDIRRTVADDSSCHTITSRSSSTISRPRSVTFGDVIVRKYAVVLGDNPNSHGPPLSLGWEHGPDRVMSVHKFERLRSSHRGTPTSTFRLASSERINLLQRQGYSNSDILQACQHIHLFQKVINGHGAGESTLQAHHQHPSRQPPRRRSVAASSA